MGIRETHQILVWLRKLAIAPVLLYRRARYGYAFRRIRFSQPTYAIVDPGDYDRLRKYEWLCIKGRRNFYAVRHKAIGNSAKKTIVHMHREVIQTPKSRLVDHINTDGIDNRRANLRKATYSENARNRRKWSIPCTSKYKGVSWRKDIAKWRAYIDLHGRRINLGCFPSELKAARAYDAAAKEHHGEFACLNFSEKQPSRRAALYAAIRKKCKALRRDLSGFVARVVVSRALAAYSWIRLLRFSSPQDFLCALCIANAHYLVFLASIFMRQLL